VDRGQELGKISDFEIWGIYRNYLEGGETITTTSIEIIVYQLPSSKTIAMRLSIRSWGDMRTKPGICLELDGNYIPSAALVNSP
jgi:hypothetical protein